MYLFKLKGLSMSEAKVDGQKYIDMLSFNDKKNVASSALSGGMKRKLHLAMALTGSSKVIIDLFHTFCNFRKLVIYHETDYAHTLTVFSLF